MIITNGVVWCDGRHESEWERKKRVSNLRRRDLGPARALARVCVILLSAEITHSYTLTRRGPPEFIHARTLYYILVTYCARSSLTCKFPARNEYNTHVCAIFFLWRDLRVLFVYIPTRFLSFATKFGHVFSFFAKKISAWLYYYLMHGH